METRLQDLLDSIGADTTDPAQPGEPDGDARSCQARAALVFDAADPLGDAFDACL